MIQTIDRTAMTEICLMEEGCFEIYQEEEASMLLASGLIYLCQCDDECAPDYFAHFSDNEVTTWATIDALLAEEAK